MVPCLRKSWDVWVNECCRGGGKGWLALFAGIQVRHDQDLGYMHHKFAIVDKKVLITGSLNWTTQAIQNNRENVLIMEDEDYVRLFLEEFERIWEEFNPTKYTFFPQKKRSHWSCAFTSVFKLEGREVFNVVETRPNLQRMGPKTRLCLPQSHCELMVPESAFCLREISTLEKKSFKFLFIKY